MTIIRALNHLHMALYADFGTLPSSEQSTIIISLQDLVDKLARSIEPPTQKEPTPWAKKPAAPEPHSKPSG